MYSGYRVKKERLFRLWRSLFSFCRAIRESVTLRLSEWLRIP